MQTNSGKRLDYMFRLIDQALEARDQTVATLLAARTSTGLYSSYFDDRQSDSFTVSAIAAIALCEAGEEAATTAHEVIDELLARQDDSGAWHAQAGSAETVLYHTLSTSWCLLACLKVQPTKVDRLLSAAMWLASQADAQTGAWGFVSHAHPQFQGGNPFFTAFAVNALHEYLVRHDRGKVRSNATAAQIALIEERVISGLRYLLEHRLSGPEFDQLLFWPQSVANPSVCIATSSIAYHIISKARSRVMERFAGAESVFSKLGDSVEELCAAFAKENLNTHSITISRFKDRKIVPLWPSIHVTIPVNYTYYFFLPIVATTFLEVASKVRPKNLGPWKAATANLTRWLIENNLQLKDGSHVYMHAGGRVSLWSTAQAALALGRVLARPDWIADEPDSSLGAPLPSLVEQGVPFLEGPQGGAVATSYFSQARELSLVLGRTHPDREDIRLALEGAQINPATFVLAGSSANMWISVFKQLEGNSDDALRLLNFLSAERPNLSALKDIIRSLEKAEGTQNGRVE